MNHAERVMTIVIVFGLFVINEIVEVFRNRRNRE